MIYKVSAIKTTEFQVRKTTSEASSDIRVETNAA